jgi:ribonuclease P protein component
MSRNFLRSSWQFRYVYAHGKKAYCKHSILFCHKTGEQGDGPRFGVVASKKVGNAVERSRAKRLLREALRATENRLIERDLWIVVVARKNILTCKTPDVLEDLENTMMAEGLIREPVL